MDQNPLGKLYTLRESVVAAATCTAHCNLNRVLILIAPWTFLCLLYSKITTDLKTNSHAGSKRDFIILTFHTFYCSLEPETITEVKIVCYLKEHHDKSLELKVISRMILDLRRSARIQAKAISLF